MSNELTVVIDEMVNERKQLANVDVAALMRMGQRFTAAQSANRNIIKDYIYFAADPYYVDNSLN